MSVTADEANLTTNAMISAKYRVDIPVGGDEGSASKTLICAHKTPSGAVNYAIGKNQDLVICDGNSDGVAILQRFTLEFKIKKVMFHSFKSSRNAVKKSTKMNSLRAGSETSWNDEENAKERGFLIVCGDHRLLFIAVADYHFYHYEIPFKLRNAFTIENAVLIERFYDATNEMNFHYHDTFHLYSLSGPFGELLPVIYKTIGNQPHWKFCWQSHQDDAEMVGTAQNFVVVYDQKEKNHRIYMSRETEEEEVQSAIRYVETQRRQFHESTLFANSNQFSARTPRQLAEGTATQSVQSPMMPFSEVIGSEIDGRSPHPGVSRHGFGHSTPNNANAQYQGTLPTPVFEGASDSKIWATTPGTPRINTRGNLKNLERNIHTRSLARMAQTEDNNSPHDSAMPGTSTQNTANSPYNPTAPTSIASPYGISQFGTPKIPSQRLKRENRNADLLREFTRMIRDTPRRKAKVVDMMDEHEHMDFGDLERDPDLDLLLSKVCLECVYIEPKPSLLGRADKIFLSHCLSQYYLNFVAFESQKMKVIPVWKSSTTTKKKLVGNSNGKIAVITCKDATVLESSGSTVIMELDNSVVLYGGKEKISLFYVNQQGTPLADESRLHSFAGNAFVTIDDHTLAKIELPSTCQCETSTDLMRTCFSYLPLEFAQYLLRLWRSTVKATIDEKMYKTMEIQELHDVALFFMENVGVMVDNMASRESSASPDVEAKQMRPRKTPSETISRMREFLEECDGQCQLPKDDLEKKQVNLSIKVQVASVENLRAVFLAMHAQFEEWTLNAFTHHLVLHLVDYLHILATVLGEIKYLNYYKHCYYRMFKETSFIFVSTGEHECHTPSVPLRAMHIIGRISTTPDPLSAYAEECAHATKKTLRLIAVAAAGANLINNVKVDCSLWLGDEFVKRLGLNGEIRKGFFKILSAFYSDGPEKAYNLMLLFKIDEVQITRMIMGLRILFLKYQADAYVGMKTLEPKECIWPTKDETAMIWAYRFPNDIRVKNVEAFLDSSKPVLIATHILAGPEGTVKEKQDKYLQQTAIRYFTQSFGRAFLNFRTEVPTLLQPLDFAVIATGGSLYPARVSCDPPANDIFRTNLDWAEFYNGVSAALQIGSIDTVKMDTEWMLMTAKTIRHSPTVSGVLLGFGLNGHLAALNMYHAHQMLASFDRFNSVALLLGLSASKFKSCDNQVFKILATYLPFLMGPSMVEIKMDSTVQTAAVTALGLLFADSGNMNIAKQLVNEIGRSPNTEDEPQSDRFAYKLSAGFSLGLIMLGKGNGSTVTSLPFKQNIPQISERLICMMNGGLRSQCVFLPQTLIPAPAEATTLPFGPPGGGPGHSANQIPNHVQDSDYINIHLSSQPAIIALGFMFMKTGDDYIANLLELPESITDLEKIRPDHVYTRILAYCIIMWDDIEIEDEFVEGMVPGIITEYLEIALKWTPRSERAGGRSRESENEFWDEVVDRQTLAQTYLMCVAGACTAIALKFSCSGGPKEQNNGKKAFDLLQHFASIVHPEGDYEKKPIHRRVCEFAGPAIVSSVFSTLVMAMGVLNAGLGDKGTMRHARLLRMYEKLTNDNWGHNWMKHHEQLFAHQTFGMLLMGHGRYAFKNDDLSIALVIISILPVVCHNISENTQYHQPLRFLWALAAEPRLLVPYDPFASEVVECDCAITLKEPYDARNNTKYLVKAPYLLPPLRDIRCIEIGGGEFELVRISLGTDEERELMEEILSIGQGRIKLKRFGKAIDEYRLEDHEDMCAKPIDIIDMLTAEDSALEFSDDDYDHTERGLTDILRMKHADKYPNVQMHLNSFREAIDLTTEVMAPIQALNIDLTQKVITGWKTEHYLAYKLQRVLRKMNSKANSSPSPASSSPSTSSTASS